MSIQTALYHRTTYRYDRLISLGPQIVRLRPAPHCRTRIASYSLDIRPRNHFLNWQQDPHGNYLARLVFPERTREFEIVVDLVADVAVINPFDFFLEPAAEKMPFSYDESLSEELTAFRAIEESGPLLTERLALIDRSRPRKTIDLLVEINQALQQDIAYIVRLEAGVQSCEETLRNRRGSCRDTAWLLVQIFRHLGLAARFVSGYLIQLMPDVKPLTGPPGPPADFTDLHAWAEVYLPGAGWIGFDPTSGLLAGEGHIPLAATPSPAGAAPVTGAVDESEVQFEYDMRVARIRETARVTKPYTEEQWRRIDRLGKSIDREIAAAGLRLTMGGEPTFVSIDDMEGPEWNIEALGPMKRKLAGVLLRRLQKKWAPGALLHYGQGKWYPGESLPRWALACHWRPDGEAVWRDTSLLAADGEQAGADFHGAQRFGEVLSRRLQLDSSFVIAGYEDAWHYLQRERRLPNNVDPHESNLRDPEERARLARVFDRGLEVPVGFALPLQRVSGEAGAYWRSSPWFFRSEHMYLLPGDSPMGLRLPLDSLPYAVEGEEPLFYEADPFAPLEPLPPREVLGRQASQPHRAVGMDTGRRRGQLMPQRPILQAGIEGRKQSSRSQSPAEVVRTALCLEPRDGILHVFMPPVGRLEDYLDLVAAVEDAAAEIGTPLRIEGYGPPRDRRLSQFSITPDPGVIEVNIQPAASWDELVDNTVTLYEEARQSRLGTEKFMIDGRHVGTGGGNHVVIGGPSPDVSPMLRRPDLLRSLISFWLNHPSLSYLFSGLYIGPTSQAPRIDEARNDAIAELELAFQQLPESGEAAPWLIDRVLRNLLVDVTGNTHRTEFCIDKLYSPDGPAGRLGLVELRAFEMPPHARMSLAQQLLLRACIAGFARQPYRRKLIRWGTRLHDRFLLPHFVREDFGDAIEELQIAGYPLESEWFAPHVEFRFPEIGTVVHRDISLELRHALEPWPVLGEEPGAGATARYVDSSLERLQVKVRNLIDGRHLVACNGVQVPLHPTGNVGEFVAGIRHRAWAPPSSLHPTIGVHTPLVLDIVDTWNERSIGGCTYHVAHPGGRNYDTFPVNANEAEARRRARFFPIGHTPGTHLTTKTAPIREFPFTLDLRYAPSAQRESP